MRESIKNLTGGELQPRVASKYPLLLLNSPSDNLSLAVLDESLGKCFLSYHKCNHEEIRSGLGFLAATKKTALHACG